MYVTENRNALGHDSAHAGNRPIDVAHPLRIVIGDDTVFSDQDGLAGALVDISDGAIRTHALGCRGLHFGLGRQQGRHERLPPKQTVNLRLVQGASELDALGYFACGPVAETGENLWRVCSQPATAGCKPGRSRVVVEGDDRPDAFGMTTVDDAKVVVQGSLGELPLIRLDTRPFE